MHSESAHSAQHVRLTDVTLAAERGYAPLGPEFAGFVVLEAALRLREVGGGVVSASEIALDAGGQLHLAAPPKRADEACCVAELRCRLRELLDVATSSTPSLRLCARRREVTSLAMLIRELQGALVPLNRAASRRGVARIAKETFDARNRGLLEGGSSTEASPSDPPPVVMPARVSTRKVVAKASVAPKVEPPREVTPSAPMAAAAYDEMSPPPPAEEQTPYVPQGGWIHPTGAPPAVASDDPFASFGDGPGDGGDEGFEIVSNLPPIVTSAPPAYAPLTSQEKSSTIPGLGAAPVRSDADQAEKAERVRALVEGFQVSRVRDDRGLSRDLKEMVGVETSPPPQVSFEVPRAELADESTSMAEADEPSSTFDDEPPRPRRRGARVLCFVALGGMLACAVVAGTAKGRAAFRSMLTTSAPPGDVQAPPSPKTPITAAAAPKALPSSICEASLTLTGVPAGAEVVRRLGVAPLSAMVPAREPLDLVAVIAGMPPRRVHVDVSAPWIDGPTGAHLDLPATIDAGPDTSWPAPLSGAAGAMGTMGKGPRGTLKITSTPNGATIWLAADPASMQGLPCALPVDLMVIAGKTAPRSLHVDWSAFTGSPPHAQAKL